MTLPLSVFRAFALLVVLLVCTAAGAGERVLYEKPSAYNTIIVTEDDSGLRTLRFERGGARQSVVKLGDPDYLGFQYTPVAFLGIALADAPRRFLVVGLGGGTMPMFLRKHYPEATIDVVDIDPDVVQVAKDFFGFTEDGNMRAHVADGRKFVEAVQQPYDVIFLDAFGPRNVPPPLATVEFMRAVRKAVQPSGVVVGNVWAQEVNTLYNSMVRTYQEVFEELYVLPVTGTANRILLALPRKQSLEREEFRELARKLGASKSFPYDAGDPNIYSFTRAYRKSSDVRVLRDADFSTRARVRAQ